MKALDVARKVAEDKTALAFKETAPGSKEYEVKSYFDIPEEELETEHGWTMLDMFSASLIVQLYNALNERNKAKYESYPLQVMAHIAFETTK